MRAADIAVLFHHLYWMRDRILDLADGHAVDLAASVPGGRTLRAILVHELDVEWSWRERLRSADPTRFAPDDQELDPADFPDVATIRARWAQDEAQMRGWLATLSDAVLEAPCVAEAGAGHPFWFHLQHLYTHAVQQFADAAVALTAVGRSPGELDFLDYVRGRS